MTNTGILFASAVVIGFGLSLTSCFNQQSHPPTAPRKPVPEKPRNGSWISGTISQAKDIYDGDTITLSSPDNTHIYKIRMWGIDAFELGQRCRINASILPCGMIGRDRLREHVKTLSDQKISCLVKGNDRYRRVLAQCFAGEVDLGRLLVREGLALAYQDNPAYKSSENEANTLKKGAWAGSFVTPQDWRKHCKPKPRNGASRPAECLM